MTTATDTGATLEELAPLVQAWIHGNRTAQQLGDTAGAYQVADMLGFQRETQAWQWCMRGAIEYLINGLAY